MVDVLRVRTGSSKQTPAELSTGRLCSGVDMWRHRGGMSLTSPGRLEMSRGSVEAKQEDKTGCPHVFNKRGENEQQKVSAG